MNLNVKSKEKKVPPLIEEMQDNKKEEKPKSEIVDDLPKEHEVDVIETKSDDTEPKKSVNKQPIWQQSHGKFTKVEKKP